MAWKPGKNEIGLREMRERRFAENQQRLKDEALKAIPKPAPTAAKPPAKKAKKKSAAARAKRSAAP